MDPACTSEDLTHVRSLFHTIDVDHNGVLNKAEVTRVMTQLHNGKSPNASEVEECFCKMDKDKNGQIDESEFVSAISEWLVSIRSTLGSPSQKRQQEIMKRLSHSNSDDFDVSDGASKTNVLLDVADFFDMFRTVQDFDERQRRILSRPRALLNCEKLRFSFKKRSEDDKREHMKAIMEVLQGGLSAQVELQKAIWSSNGDVLVQGLERLVFLLSTVEVCAEVAEKFEYASALYAIYSAITGSAEAPQILGEPGSEYESKPLPHMIDRLVQLVDLPAELKAIQNLALDALYYYVLGPRVPVSTVSNIWHPTVHYSKEVVHSKNLLHNLIEVTKKNAYLTAENQPLLVKVVHCIGVFADGSPKHLKEALTLGLRETVLSYMSQKDFMFSLDMMRALSGTLAILCGHFTGFFGETRNDEVIAFTSETQMMDVLKVVHDIVFAMLAGGQTTCNPVLVDDTILIHSMTIIGLILPLIPLTHLQTSCGGLISLMMTALTRSWSSIDAAKVATARINHALVDIMDSPDPSNADSAAARWLFSFTEFRRSIHSQLEAGLSYEMNNLCMSALHVIDELIFADLREEVVMEYYQPLLGLLYSPFVRTHVVNILTSLCAPKPFIIHLLKNRIVESFFSVLRKYRLRAFVTNPNSQILEIEPVFNTAKLMNVVSTLIDILDCEHAAIDNCPISAREYTCIKSSVFTLEHVDEVRSFHGVICSQIESCTLVLEREPALPHLLEMLTWLLLKIKDLHVQSNSFIATTISKEIDLLLSTWKSGLEGAYERGEASLRKQQKLLLNPDGSMELDEEVPIAKRLRYLNHSIGGDDLEILLKPSWKDHDIDGKVVGLNERLFLVPKAVMVEDLTRAIGNFYAKLIVLSISSPLQLSKDDDVSPRRRAIQSQDALAKCIESAELDNRVQMHKKIPRICLDVNPVMAGDINFFNADHALQQPLKARDEALREVQREALQRGVRIDGSIMNVFYDFFNARGTSAINIEDFVEFMNVKLSVADAKARPLFRMFDTDNSGNLTLSEIAIGLAILVEGSDDDRIIAAFNAYDADKSGQLDFEEVVNLVCVVKSVARHAACLYTKAAFSVLGLKDTDSLSLEQFVKLVKDGHLSLDLLLPNLKSNYKFGNQFRRSNNQKYSGFQYNEPNFVFNVNAKSQGFAADEIPNSAFTASFFKPGHDKQVSFGGTNGANGGDRNGGFQRPGPINTGSNPGLGADMDCVTQPGAGVGQLLDMNSANAMSFQSYQSMKHQRQYGKQSNLFTQRKQIPDPGASFARKGRVRFEQDPGQAQVGGQGQATGQLSPNSNLSLRSPTLPSPKRGSETDVGSSFGGKKSRSPNPFANRYPSET